MLSHHPIKNLTANEKGGVGLNWSKMCFGLCLHLPTGLFAPVSKINKVSDQTPSSVTSTPKTPRMGFSRVAGKIKKDKKEKKEREAEKGGEVKVDTNHRAIFSP